MIKTKLWKRYSTETQTGDSQKKTNNIYNINNCIKDSPIGWAFYRLVSGRFDLLLIAYIYFNAFAHMIIFVAILANLAEPAIHSLIYIHSVGLIIVQTVF